MSWAKKGDRPHPIARQNADLLHVWTALRCMALGTATRAEWSDLSDAINMVEALCDIGKFDDTKVMPHVTAAIAGMVTAMRGNQQAMTMPEAGLTALSEVCQFYDNALFKFSANTLDAARDHFIETVRRHKVAPTESTLVVMS